MNVTAKIVKLREHCKQTGIPLTQQRLEAYRELISHEGHPSPEEIHQRLRERYPTISLATVYNNLEALSKMGFARKINPLSDHARYDGDLSSHSHFVCISCKKVEDIESEAINKIQIPDPDNFEHQISLKTIIFTGICSACNNNTQD